MIAESLPASAASLVQTIGLDHAPYGVLPQAVSSDGTHVWVTSGNALTELEASTGQVVRTIYNPENNGHGVLYGVSSDGTHVWVTDDLGNTVTELDASTGAVVQTIGVGDTPYAVSSDGTHVWVANNASSTVTELDASTGAVVGTIGIVAPGAAPPNGISSDGTHVWVTSGNTVTELDASTGAVVGTIGIVGPGYPNGISSDGTHVWTANAGDDTVSEIATGSAPATTVVLPANNATISGTPYLDATAPKATRVTHEVSGGPSDLSDVQVAAATQTIYGWVATWNTTTVPNGTYTLQSVASAGAQVLAPSGGISVTVDNPAPATTVVLPANDATISGTPYLDATASSGVTKVTYEVSGGPSDLSDVQVATGTGTLIGWLAAWNTTTVPDGTYTLQSVASYAGGVSGTSAGISVTVDN